MTERIDVALIGCGHMGRHHARVIAKDPRCRLVAAVDVIQERATVVADRYGSRAESVVPDGVDAVVVATPTTTHLDVTAPLLARGVWCLVEKPLAHTVSAARYLKDAPRVAVGHIERFNPAVRSSLGVRPQVVEARRLAPPSDRGRDVDVVHDLMVHDLDLLLGWGGDVVWVDAVGVAVLGDTIDTASVRLRMENGLTATLLASRVAETAERRMRLYENGRYTSLDLLTGIAHTDSGPLSPPDTRDALTAQWDAFIAAVRADTRPVVGAEQGVKAVALAEQIVRQIRRDP